MEQNNSYQSFKSSFEEENLDQLVKYFNRQVGNRGFNSARAAFDKGLINEFIRRGIDVSEVYNGKTINFSQSIMINQGRIMTQPHVTPTL